MATSIKQSSSIKKFLSPKEIKFINDNYLTSSSKEIAVKLKRQKNTIKSYLYRNNLHVSKEIAVGFSIKAMSKKTTSTPYIDRKIKKYYLQLPVKKLAAMVGKSSCFINTRLRQLNLEIPQEIKEKRKQDTRMKVGNTPANKGKKMSPELYAKMSHTMFKKGQVPANIKEVGYERISKEGYVEIRVINSRTCNNFELKHRNMYEKHFGVTLKDDEIVIFINGDKRDFRIENLQKITFRENMLRNTIHNYPENIKDIIRIKSSLQRKINKIQQHG